MPKRIGSEPSVSVPETQARLEREKIISAPPPRKKAEALDIKKVQASEKSQMQEARQELREKELIGKVMQDGGFSVDAWFPAEFSPKGENGFCDLGNRMKYKRGAAVLKEAEKQSGVDLVGERGELQDKEINEFIDIRHMIEPRVEKVVIPGKKGFLGFGKTPDKTILRKTGEPESVMHKNIVAGGKNEPAVQFSYIIAGSLEARKKYRDAGGRHGKGFKFQLVLPESVARELAQEVDKDPTIMRNIVERSMKEKLLQDQEVWEKSVGEGDPMRPPWEEWDKSEEGSKIYVQKEGPKGWRDDCVHKIKK